MKQGNRGSLPKLLSLLGTVVVIPWELMSDFVLSFLAQGGERTLWTVAFFWFAFRLNIAAILISWVKPRFAAWWILVNIVVSMAITIFWFSPSWGVAGRHFGTLNPFKETLELVYSVALVLITPTVFAVGMLIVLKREQNAGNGSFPISRHNGSGASV
jgi:hypothetical protein